MQEITIYTTPVCGFCVAAKRLLSQKGLPYKEIDVARNSELRARLIKENNGYRTVPMIFIGKEFIGGYTELAELDRVGHLDDKVNGA